jgi:pyruvate dehydrogenase E2 component (dihydrolipoamide acetyltransferase)
MEIIAVEDCFVTPVIKQAEKITLMEISQGVKDLAGTVKDNKLSPDDLVGGTITVSNISTLGIDQIVVGQRI